MKKNNLLIIEPSKELSDILASAFQKNGFKVSVAHTSQEGISCADKITPEIVVMEIIMPNHNGMEFMHEFRSYPEWLDIPIIIYSHISRDELGLDDRALKSMGIHKHLYKPTASLGDLVSAVESRLATVNI